MLVERSVSDLADPRVGSWAASSAVWLASAWDGLKVACLDVLMAAQSVAWLAALWDVAWVAVLVAL